MPFGGGFPFSFGGGLIVPPVEPPIVVGGPPTPLPWVVNIVPVPDEQETKLLKPIRFSIRDSNTFIDPTNIRVKVGYAKVFSNGDEVFDTLPRTKRVSLTAGIAGEPGITVLGEGVQIEKTLNANQRSVYATSVAAGPGFQSAVITAVVRPDVVTALSTGSSANPLGSFPFPGQLMPLPFSPLEGAAFEPHGAILGMEHGPRNMAVYLRFQRLADNSRFIRLTSFVGNDGSAPTLNTAAVFDWSTLRRYTMVWNEVEGFLEVYGHQTTTTTRLFKVAISSIPQMPADLFAKAGAAGDITALYGQIGPMGDRSTWANIAVTTDVGYPVVGTVRPGDFTTLIRGSENVVTDGSSDPRDIDISSWHTAPLTVLPDQDLTSLSGSENGVFKILKNELSKTYALYRQEPALYASSTDGFMVDARISATEYQLSSSATGMGIVIFDGTSVFHLQLFDDSAVKTVGLLKKDGVIGDIADYFLPSTPINWELEHRFRLVVDPRRNCIRLYDGDDLANSVLDIPFDRNTLPDAADFDWEDFTPFVLFGHTLETATKGIFNLRELSFCHLYQAWDSEDGVSPNLAPTDPIFTRTTSGSSAISMASGELVITSSTGGLDKFNRTASFGPSRGGIIEARLKISKWRPLSRTGTYLILDDGVHSYGLSFLENNLGKFVTLSRRNGVGGLSEIAGRDGDGATVSFLLDWDQYHTYRLERLPLEGLRVFVDNEPTPRLEYPESKIALMADPIFGGTPNIAFGQFSSEGATSHWSFVRGLFSRGFELSFKKNKPDSILRDELISTQVIIVAHVVDGD